MIGQTLGPYRVLEKLGEGGMGEVYRARDTKLNRDAAIKVLPAAFARDASGVARLRREAQVLASLNHPHIASIHGLEESNGMLALALEFVEGDDLATRLGRGAIPVEEAVAYAKQIVDALEAAHEKGIVHRDLKPANIKVTKDGAIKVLDFGLAKACEADVALASGDPGQSPTRTRLGTTEVGVIMGTAAYMSPEQARGRPIDKRSDIWAFGVVLFEMLTGRQLFPGETSSDTLASVLTREIDWTNLPKTTSPGVRRLLTRCLERDPRKRLRDIGDARLDLDDHVGAAIPGASVPRRSLLRALPWALAAGAVLLAVWAVWGRTGLATTSPDVMQLDLAFPPDLEPLTPTAAGLAISPDGRSVLMIGIRDGVRTLFIRRIDRVEATEVPGTSSVNGAAFSPDGGSIAFIPGSGSIVRVSLADQQRKILTSGADLAGGLAWSPAGIVFNRDGALWAVSPEGGSPRALTTLDAARREILHDHPLVLPGERLVLFASMTTQPDTERIEAVSIDGGKRSVVVERAMSPVWSPTGHLLFARDGAVLAVPFDPRAFEPKVLIASPAYEGGAQLSSDRKWLLYQSNASGQAEIYVRRYPALDRQWQVSEGGGVQARWSRDSREIFYRSGKRIIAVPVDGSGAEPVFGKPVPLFPDEYDFGRGLSIANYDVTPDGRFIMLRRGPHGGRLRAVINWTEELKRILASGGVR